jgi:ABC-type taurine transport system substrate-binding protein
VSTPNGKDDTVAAALDQAQRWLDTIPGVTGVGQGEQDGQPTIDVWVTDPEWADNLPHEVHGLPVRVHDTGGPITPQRPR